jgi:hypothetical protein
VLLSAGSFRSFRSVGFATFTIFRTRIRLRSKRTVIGEIIVEIYEVQLCRRGRWEQQHWRVVAARDEGEAAYKVTGEHLRKEGDPKKIRVRVVRLGNGSPPATLFYAA